MPMFFFAPPPLSRLFRQAPAVALAALVALLGAICVPSSAEDAAPTWGDAQWIWQEADGPPNTWVAFRKDFELEDVPTTAIANIATDTKYWLWLNGEMVVFEGGLARGPMPDGSYFDQVDLAEHLKPGTNSLAVLVWYWGKTAKTHEDSGKGGLLFSAELGDRALRSDSSWKLKPHPAYDPKSRGLNRSANRPNAMDVKYDARMAMGDWTPEAWYQPGNSDKPGHSGQPFDSWQNAIEKGQADSLPWGTLVKRPIPQWVDRGLVDYEQLRVGGRDIELPFVAPEGEPTVIFAKLPKNIQITPYLKVRSKPGVTVEIGTDNPFNLIEAQYTTAKGSQAFETYSWMNGHQVKYTVPAGVEVEELKYRWTSIEPILGRFECSDPFFERLWEMAGNTLHICARDSYMDCPDRERGLWLGDVADQTGPVFYTLGETGRLLLKKGIENTFAYQTGDIIQGLAPGFGEYRGKSSELCAQSLQYIEQGIWRYYFNSGDRETLAYAYPFVKRYLELWKMLPNGMPENRRGYAGWVDWGLNADPPAVNVCWYHMALESAKRMAVELGETDDLPWYEGRLAEIEANYDKVYWRDGWYGTEGRAKDERVSALAVLTGLADPSRYESLLKEVLIPEHNASPHMEWVVEEAIMLTGRYEAGLERMRIRHEDQVSDADLTTLYERYANDTRPRGTPNHAWNAPNYVLSRYIAGIEALEVAWKSFQVLPRMVHLTAIRQVVPSVQGIITADMKLEDDAFTLALESPESTTAIVGIPKASVSPESVSANGVTVWKNGSFVAGQPGVAWSGEDADFIKFSVDGGTWTFVAK